MTTPEAPAGPGLAAELGAELRAALPSGGIHPLWSRFLWGATFAVVGAALLWVLRPVFAILAASAGLAYILDPVVDWLERRGLSRESGIGVIYASFVMALLATVLLFIPAVAAQADQVEAKLTPVIDHLDERLLPILAVIEAKTGQTITLDLHQLQAEAPRWVKEHLPDIRATATGLGKGLFTQGLGLMSALLNLLLLPVFLFYLLRDWDRMVAAVGELVPPRHRPRVVRIATEVDVRLGAFVRGQITVCLALSGLYSVGLLIVGIDLAVGVGVMAGLLFIVPYLGTVVGVVLSVLLALIKFGISWQVIGVVVVFVVVQGIEGYVLTPRIVGDKVGLPPLVVMIALIVGGGLLGIWGMLIAIPVTAVLSVVAAEWLGLYRNSKVFTGG